jgi:hypothetical protein
VDRVEHASVAGDLCLGAVLRRGLLLDQRYDARMRCGHVLDRVGRLNALDPRDLGQRLQRLRVLEAERALAASTLVDGTERDRHRRGHHPDLTLKRPERVHRGSRLNVALTART